MMMYRRITRWMLVGWVSLVLSGCMDLGGGLWTGAMLVYDRHNVYKKLNDYQLGADANRALFHDMHLKCEGCAVDLAVFHRDVLLTGHVPSRALRKEAQARVAAIPGIRKQYNQLAISSRSDNTVQDAWITAKIRSQVVANADINPRQFKVVTADRIVYLMGDVLPDQGARVIHVARQTDGVFRVVKLFNYYRLSSE